MNNFTNSNEPQKSGDPYPVYDPPVPEPVPDPEPNPEPFPFPPEPIPAFPPDVTF